MDVNMGKPAHFSTLAWLQIQACTVQVFSQKNNKNENCLDPPVN
jgi:hypothetical protein